MNAPGGLHPTPTTLLVDELTGNKTFIARGGFAAVFAVQGFRLPDFSGPLAYKEFFHPVAATGSSSIQDVIVARRNLPPKEGRQLLDAGTWPLRAVLDGSGFVRGVLMPLLGKEWFDEIRAFTGGSSPKTRSVDQLFSSPDERRFWGWSVPESADILTRFRLCASFSKSLALMHRVGIVFGDISQNNTVYRLAPAPGVRFIDCDAAWVGGREPLFKPTNTPHWVPPEWDRGLGLDEATDQYKLGLFILRCLTSGRGAPTRTDPGRASSVLDQVGMDLLELSVGTERASRPTAQRWSDYFADRLAALTAPPSIVGAFVEPQVAPLGERVTLTVVSRGAQSLTIVSPAGRATHVDSPGDKHVLAVAADAPGSWKVTGENRFGRSAAVLTESVTVMTPPRIRLQPIPDVSVLDVDVHPGASVLQQVLAPFAEDTFVALNGHPATPSPMDLQAQTLPVLPPWPGFASSSAGPASPVYAEPDFSVQPQQFGSSSGPSTPFRRRRRAS